MIDSSTAVEALLSALSTNRNWQEDFYRDLHAHPELSHQEYETAPKSPPGCAIAAMTSTTESARLESSELRNGPGPTVLLRADMDALPVKESTGLDYPSTVQTTDDNGNAIPDRADLQLNIRTYSRQTRTTMLDAIRRIVTAECQASGSPREPGFEGFDDGHRPPDNLSRK